MTDQTLPQSRGETDAEREHRRSRLSSMLDDLQNAIPAGGRWDVRMSAERRMALMAFIRGEIESLASETKGRAWISCATRLPEYADCEKDSGYVLAWFKGGPQMVRHFTEVRRWQLEADPIPHSYWMPFPEAP